MEHYAGIDVSHLIFPHFSNRSKYVCEQRLLEQHLREPLHQRAEPLVAHGGD